MAAHTQAFEALYIPANDTPWFPYGQSGCEVQLIHAEPATGKWIVKLRGPVGGNLGVHRHYGSVVGFTLRGGWRYLEHEWIARPGDIVHETPGSVHTLLLDEDTEIVFFVEGALEYLDPLGKTLAHEDWRSITDKYLDYCAERGLQAIDVSRPRRPSADPILA